MSDFWPFARRMLRYPAALAGGLLFALIAATGLGVGVASALPLMQMMLGRERQRSLSDLATQFNEADHWVSIPAAVAERLPDDPYRGVLLMLAGIGFLTVFAATCTFLHQYLSLQVATRTVARIRQDAFRHVMLMPLVRVIERGPTEFVARIVRDVADLHHAFLALTSKSVVHVSRGVACLAVALLVSWEVALAAPVACLGLALILRRFGRRIRSGTRGSLEAQEDLLRVATESVQGLRAVKAASAEGRSNWRFHQQNRKVLREEMRARTARALAGPIVETFAAFVLGILAALFAGRIIRGGMTIEQFVVALGALGGAGASFKPLAGIVGEVQAAGAPARRVREILDEPLERSARRRPALPRHRRDIEIDAVTLRYPGADRPALDGVSLKIAHGERVAIVGPNGSGKTTLVSLLPRLVRPARGRVLIDGHDVESVGLRSLRGQIAVVTQETVIFRGTVADNIAFGLAGVSRARIVEAARQARADGFIERLGGYDADLAEQGASISGGERQRLAVARAILRDPAILILDEATSQVDAASEAEMATALGAFCRGRTALIIAHRLATVRDTGRIVVMDEGRIADEGTHEELLGRCRVYEQLVARQMIS